MNRRRRSTTTKDPVLRILQENTSHIPNGVWLVVETDRGVYLMEDPLVTVNEDKALRRALSFVQGPGRQTARVAYVRCANGRWKAYRWRPDKEK